MDSKNYLPQGIVVGEDHTQSLSPKAHRNTRVNTSALNNGNVEVLFEGGNLSPVFIVTGA